MNPFLCSHTELQAIWKSLRADLSNHPEEDQLTMVAEFWAQAPLKSIAYDPETLHDYPSPWEMMLENDWCRNSIAVGMDFTLRLSGWKADRLKIQMVKDIDISDQKLILVVDDKYYLNYEYKKVSPIPTTNRKIIDEWKYSGRHYESTQ